MTFEPLRLRAEAIDGDRCVSLPPEAAVEAIKSGDRTVWLDILAQDREAAHRLLHDELDFHELAVEDALSDQERPTLQEYGSVIFLSITAPDWDGHRLRSREIGIFLLANSVVTVTTAPSPYVDDWFTRWREHPGRVGSHPAHIMYVLLDAVVDGYFPVIDALEDEADDLTEEIFNGNSDHLADILRVKRSLLALRRAISPLRDIVNGLLRRDLGYVPDEAKPYFQDVFDHILRISEIVDTNREAMTGLLDIHLSTVSNNLNIVVKKMTVLSTVLMTSALIAGIYGMNFKYMPELDWAAGYPFALGLMVASALGILFVFRKMKWV